MLPAKAWTRPRFWIHPKTMSHRFARRRLSICMLKSSPQSVAAALNWAVDSDNTMRLTRRLAGLFFIGIVPLLVSGYAPWLLWVALSFDVVLVGMALADHLLTPDPARIVAVERTVEDKLSLGVDNRVT